MVIQQPDDHVHFLKQILTHASQNLDVAKVILISSPKVNTYEIAKQMGELTKQVAVSENALLTCMGIRVSIIIMYTTFKKVLCKGAVH